MKGILLGRAGSINLNKVAKLNKIKNEIDEEAEKIEEKN